MRGNRKFKYVFRGTTIGWKGNYSSQRLPRTSATTNPVKALLFASGCSIKGGTPIVYVTELNCLRGIKKDRNVFAVIEDEIAFVIKPVDFAAVCEGYLYLDDAIRIFKQLSIHVPQLFGTSLFDDAIKDVPLIDSDIIEQFYVLARLLLKN